MKPNKPNHDLFSTPEDYFETFPDRVMAQLPACPKKIRPRSRRWIWLGAAAAFIIGLGIWQNLPFPDTVASDQAFEDYLTMQNISQYDLIEGMDQQQIQELEVSLFNTNKSADEH